MLLHFARMARYYFHIDEPRPHQDELGENFEDDDRAWRAAVGLMRDVESGLEPGHAWRLEVYREQTPIYLISVSTSRISS